MAVIYAMDNPEAVNRIVLLAPALNFPEFSSYKIQSLDNPAWMVIGKDDTVTPAEKVVPLARTIFKALHYDEVDDDHMLARTFRNLDWKTMLGE